MTSIKSKKIVERVYQSSIYLALVHVSKRLILPGFNGLSLNYVWVFFINGIQKGAITSRASSLSFNFFLALFPAIIFFFTLIPYVPIPHFQDQLLDLIKNILPTQAFLAVRTTIEDIVRHQRGGLLSFGFIAALYFATNGVHAMIDAFNKSFHGIETRSFVKQRVISLILTISLSFLVVTAIVLIITNEYFIKWIVHHGLLKNKTQFLMLFAFKWLIIAALLFFTISFIYYYGPAKKRKWRFISAGSTLATFLSILTSIGFSYFVNNFGQYNKLYGSMGTLIVVLLWIYFNSLILLIGFELNASINKAKDENATLQKRRSKLYR
jgi:membrane protein